MTDRIVVVGAGVAGLHAAQRVRELGFSGEVVILGAEPHRPYHRPALSKDVITGDIDLDPGSPDELDLSAEMNLDAVWRLATTATRLDPLNRTVYLATRERVDYDGLVIATGVQARHLPGEPRRDQRVHVLRTVEDAVAIERTLRAESGPLVVLGGGFTGCEVAASAREMGREVTLVSRSKTLLSRGLGPATAAAVTELHRSNGVRLILGVQVRHWLSVPYGVVIHLSDGQVLLAGCAVVAAGATPAVEWLGDSGLSVDNGVLCESTCHAVGASDVVAAGDVARWPNARFAGLAEPGDAARTVEAPRVETPRVEARRVEHWLNAIEMGRAAAENLLAGKESATPFTPVPRFWSEQYGVRLQAAGAPELGQSRPLAGNAPSIGDYPRPVGSLPFGSVTGFVAGDRLVGLVGFDAPRGVLEWTAELDRQTRPESSPQWTTVSVGPAS